MFLDTASITEIRKYKKSGILKGITTNPTILLKEGKTKEKQLNLLVEEQMPIVFIQLIGESYYELKKDFDKLEKSSISEAAIGIKVPLNFEGLQMIRYLKEYSSQMKVIGTVIYSTDQAILGSLAGCDYLALYVNRMENNNLNPYEAIKQTRKFIDDRGLDTKIMGASFKNTNQIIKALNAGAHTVTIPPELFEKMANKSLTEFDIKVFNDDNQVY